MMGSASIVGLPARQAFAVDIVGPGNTMNAISVNTAGRRIIGLFGGTLAGVVIELLGVEWCFYIMVLSYVSASLILLPIHRQVVETPLRQQTIRDSYVTTLYRWEHKDRFHFFH
jgi:MFS family permease